MEAGKCGLGNNNGPRKRNNSDMVICRGSWLLAMVCLAAMYVHMYMHTSMYLSNSGDPRVSDSH